MNEVERDIAGRDAGVGLGHEDKCLDLDESTVLALDLGKVCEQGFPVKKWHLFFKKSLLASLVHNVDELCSPLCILGEHSKFFIGVCQQALEAVENCNTYVPSAHR